MITLPGGKEITIRANGLSPENRYIQAVRINGQRWCSTMFIHELIRDGAVIEFEMGAEAVEYTR